MGIGYDTIRYDFLARLLMGLTTDSSHRFPVSQHHLLPLCFQSAQQALNVRVLLVEIIMDICDHHRAIRLFEHCAHAVCVHQPRLDGAAEDIAAEVDG